MRTRPVLATLATGSSYLALAIVAFTAFPGLLLAASVCATSISENAQGQIFMATCPPNCPAPQQCTTFTGTNTDPQSPIHGYGDVSETQYWAGGGSSTYYHYNSGEHASTVSVQQCRCATWVPDDPEDPLGAGTWVFDPNGTSDDCCDVLIITGGGVYRNPGVGATGSCAGGICPTGPKCNAKRTDAGGGWYNWEPECS